MVESTVGKYFSGGAPDLSVVVFVAGVQYGPSPIIKDTHSPIWNYTFPRAIRWKYQDPVSIRILDNDWSESGVFTFNSAPGDPLAMKMLSGTVRPSKGGKTELSFSSDFAMAGAPAAMTQVRFEQAVYGSFPFRQGEYAPLAHSSGCRPEWLAAFASACQNFGEPSRASSRFDRAVFCLPIRKRGPWLIVGVSPSGDDDRGRPGALGFHGLFVAEKEFRKIGFNPFVLNEALRSEWSADTKFEPGSIPPRSHAPRENAARDASSRTPTEGSQECKDEDDVAKARRIVATLKTGRRVAIESAAPIPELAETVWSALPQKERRRKSVATWAFANGNRFDLVAVPRLELVEWDESYSDPPPRKPRFARKIPWRAVFLRILGDRVDSGGRPHDVIEAETAPPTHDDGP